MPSLRLLVGSAVTAAGLSFVALAAPASAAPATASPVTSSLPSAAVRVAASSVTPDQRAAASKAALLKAASVRVRVKTTYLGGPLTADLRISGAQCEGVFNGTKLGVMRVKYTGGVVFFTGDDTLWKNATGGDPAPLRGMWAAASLKDAKFGSLFRMCTLATQADSLYPKGLKFAAAKAKVVDGKATVAIVSVKTKVLVYLAAKGAAYPLMQVNKTGWTRYQEWNARVAPVLPPADDKILP